MMRKLFGLGVAACIAALTTFGGTVAVANPHHQPYGHITNGQIAWLQGDASLDEFVIATANPDGSHLQFPGQRFLDCPHWSPDGTRIAICSDLLITILTPDTGNIVTFPQPDPRLSRTCYVWSPDANRLACDAHSESEPTLNGLYTVRVRDGLDLRQVTSVPGGADFPGSYSPNGKRIVFARFIDEQPVGLFTVKVDGSGLRQITPPGLLVGGDSFGDWSPHGNEIVFAARRSPDARLSIFLVHANGKGLREIHFKGQPPCGGLRSDPTSRGCFDPTFSPDGRKIAFVVNEPGRTRERIFTSNIDGSNPTPISSADAYYPDWGTHPLS